MNDGIGLFNITDCQILEYFIVVTFGSELQFDDKLSEQTTATIITTTLHFSTKYSQITNSFIYVKAKKYYSFMAIIVNSCIWSDSYIKKGFDGGVVSVLIENCSFMSVTKDKDIGIEFNEALQFIIRKSKIETNGEICMLGCGIYVEGTDIVNRNIPNLRALAETLGCPFVECNFTSSKLSIENTTITGNIHTAGSVVYSRNIDLEMINCIFNMSTISPEGGVLHHASIQNGHAVKMVNMTTYLTSVKKATSVFTVICEIIEIVNVQILCPQSLHVVKTEKAHTKFYKCEYSCPKEFYTLDAGSMILNEIYQEFQLLNSSFHSSKVNCFPCPIGAYCDISIKALPNYYLFKTTNTSDVNMP